MKVFAYNTASGTKGEFLFDMARPDGFTNLVDGKFTPSNVKLPKSRDGVEWESYCEAFDRNNNPIKFDQPVCFCIGEVTCGEDQFWSWIVVA